MRIFYCLTFVFAMSCTKDTDHSVTYLGSYDVPVYLDGRRVSYKFVYSDSKDTIVHQYRMTRQNKDTVCWKKVYVNDKLEFETTYLITGGRKVLQQEVYHSDGQGF